MKNRVVWLVAALMLGFVTTGVGQVQQVSNLLQNPGFETGALEPWLRYSGGGATVTATVVRDCAGANVPEGQAQFQFKVAELNFHSTNYQWLVVAGAHAKYKGEGTINGDGEYGFMLTATDGQINGGGGVDKFRIKIWDKATEDIIYDNQLSDPDNANASQAIGGGSIVIHTGKK